jgi:hypothetical protein
MPVSSARDLPEARRGGACRGSLAARAEELNRHSPDCQRFREQDRALDRFRQRQIAVAANGPHPSSGSTSFCTCLVSRSMSASLRPATTTRARPSRRPGKYGFPPPRIVNSAVVLKSQRAPNGAEWCARSDKPFQDAGRKTTPSSGSPVVTKRQSAMTSLRASATIIVLRVPRRLSAVRARYHTASALSF